jgi:hypothetical protein
MVKVGRLVFDFGLGCEKIQYLCCGIFQGVVSTSRLHRKSDSVVEAGRPATEGNWI